MIATKDWATKRWTRDFEYWISDRDRRLKELEVDTGVSKNRTYGFGYEFGVTNKDYITPIKRIEELEETVRLLMTYLNVAIQKQPAKTTLVSNPTENINTTGK